MKTVRDEKQVLAVEHPTRRGREPKEDQIRRLVEEHHDLAVREFRRMAAELAALHDEIKILRKVIASGEQMEFPWFKLPQARRRQVELVIAYLKDHANREVYTLSRACADTFVEVPGGYPSISALRAYCYGIKLDKWGDF